MDNNKRWFIGLGAVIVVLIIVDGVMMTQRHTPVQHEDRVARVRTHTRGGSKQRHGQLYGNVQSVIANQLLAERLAPVPFSGTAIIVQNHHVVGQYSHGMADAAHGVKNSPNVSYEIDSVQKSLTAAVVMSVIRSGKLSFNDHLSAFYPQISGSQDITIREMLDMTSGLTMPVLPMPTKQMGDDAVIQRAIENLQYKPQLHGHWSYQPVNFNLLAGIVAQVTGKSYADLLKQYIRRPLSLHGTHMAYDDRAGRDTATGYNQTQPENYSKPFVATKAMAHGELGTGQVFMTPGDLYRAESAFLDGRLLSAGEANAVYGPRDNVQYSGGYYHVNNDFLYANGFGYGFETFVRISPDGKNAVIAMTNVMVPYNQMKEVLNSITQWWFIQKHDGDTVAQN